MSEKENVYEILEHIHVIKRANTGWDLELNFVRWYDHEPKFDLRWWRRSNRKYGKGITLNLDELMSLKKTMDGFPENSEYAKGMMGVNGQNQ